MVEIISWAWARQWPILVSDWKQWPPQHYYQENVVDEDNWRCISAQKPDALAKWQSSGGWCSVSSSYSYSRAGTKTGNGCNNNPHTLSNSQEIYGSSQSLHEEQEGGENLRTALVSFQHQNVFCCCRLADTKTRQRWRPTLSTYLVYLWVQTTNTAHSFLLYRVQGIDTQTPGVFQVKVQISTRTHKVFSLSWKFIFPTYKSYQNTSSICPVLQVFSIALQNDLVPIISK